MLGTFPWLNMYLGAYRHVPRRCYKGTRHLRGRSSAIPRDLELTYMVQTRMQILNPSAGAVYKGMIQSTMRIASGEGFMNLWRGMSSVVVGAGTCHAMALFRPRGTPL